MIFLNFTVELDETWNRNKGITQQVVIKINNVEAARFPPHSHIHVEDQDRELVYEAIAWIQRRTPAKDH